LLVAQISELPAREVVDESSDLDAMALQGEVTGED
jgi:hypothetical protein